ncbi:MAG: hypothetical protein JKY44_04640 [Flavobacteriaceae bacterium]|nr:hypothetical protein [Flavobacteriaceae bacterium]
MATKRTEKEASIKAASEASRFVQCSTHTDKGYIFLIRIKGNVAHIYDKKSVQGGATASTNASTKDIHLTSFELENGTTLECPCCHNAEIFTCQCGHYSCLPTGKHVCPSCRSVTQSNQRHSTNDLNATGGGGRSGGKSKPALPKGESGLFLGFKK